MGQTRAISRFRLAAIVVFMAAAALLFSSCGLWPWGKAARGEASRQSGKKTTAPKAGDEEAALTRAFTWEAEGWNAKDAPWLMAAWHPEAEAVFERGKPAMNWQDYREFAVKTMGDCHGMTYSDFKDIKIRETRASLVCTRSLLYRGAPSKEKMRFDLIRYKGVWFLAKSGFEP
jgi:hypothetical protein